MDDPTQAVDNLFRSPGKFNEQQLRVILAFMNEMDAQALQHIKNDPEEDVMRTLTRMQQNSNGRDEEDIPLINFNDATESAGGILKSNGGMFKKYRTSLGRFGGDIYREATNNSYEYASKVLTALAGLAGVGSVSAAVAASREATLLLTNMAVRYLMGGITGISLAGIAVISLRNHLGAQQKLSNKELLDMMKRVAEARIGLNKFFSEVRVKIIKEPEKDKIITAFENYWTKTVSPADRNSQPVDRVEILLFTTLMQPGDIHARILIEDNANYVALGRGRDSSISRDEMKLVAEVVQVL
jgi:hypothetical protein